MILKFSKKTFQTLLTKLFIKKKIQIEKFKNLNSIFQIIFLLVICKQETTKKFSDLLILVC